MVVPTGIPGTAAEEGNAGKGKGKEGTRGDEVCLLFLLLLGIFRPKLSRGC